MHLVFSDGTFFFHDDSESKHTYPRVVSQVFLHRNLPEGTFLFQNFWRDRVVSVSSRCGASCGGTGAQARGKKKKRKKSRRRGIGWWGWSQKWRGYTTISHHTLHRTRTLWSHHRYLRGGPIQRNPTTLSDALEP